MKQTIIAFTFFVGLLVAIPAAADTFVRTSSQFELPQGQQIDGNFLGVGNPISVAGEVVEDATLFGNRITVTGSVKGDVLAVGVLTRLDGVIGEDVRIFSGNATISGSIMGDVLLVGGSVDVLSDAVIEGDLLIYAGSALVSGTIGGDVIGTTQNLTIDGQVAGAVDVQVSQLILGPNAAVAGSVRYTSVNLVSQSLGTTVGGAVLKNDPVYTAGSFSLGSALYPVLILLFSTLIWFTLSRRTLIHLVQQTATVLPRSAITGVISFFVTPLLVFVLTVSLLGGYLLISNITTSNSTFAFVVAVIPALVVLFGYLTLFFLAVIAVPAFIGKICMNLSKKTDTDVSVMSICIGALVCVILLLLPAVGVFIFFFVAIIILGGLLEGLVRAGR